MTLQSTHSAAPPPSSPQVVPVFVNCEKGAAVSLRATISMFNLKPDGRRDYLSIGETELDVIYWVSDVMLVCVLAGVCVIRRRRDYLSVGETELDALYWVSRFNKCVP